MYVGQAEDVSRRWQQYARLDCKCQKKLHKSLTEFGWDAHKKEIIHECDIELLDHWEAYYIALHRTFNTKHGLNSTMGGDAPMRGQKHTEATLEKLSIKVIQYSLDGIFIKIWHSITSAANEFDVSISSISHVVDKKKTSCEFIWKRYTDDYVLKLDKAYVRAAMLTGKEIAVNQYAMDGTFIKAWDSATEAQNELGFLNVLISAVCNKKAGYGSAYGYLWKFASDTEPVFYIDKTKHRAIIQYDLLGSKIREWESSNAIEKELGFKRMPIHNGCRGCCKTVHGFIWRYVDERGKIVPILITPIKRTEKPVIQYTLQGIKVHRWSSARQVKNQAGFNSQMITDCCDKNTTSAYGFVWKYEEDANPIDFIEISSRNKKLKPVIQYDLTWTEVARFNSAAEASKSLGIHQSSISDCCRGKTFLTHWFHFKYVCDTEKQKQAS